jgi:hypothetical protein
MFVFQTLAALRDDKTMMQLCFYFKLAPQQIIDWKRQLLEGASCVFGTGRDKTQVVDLVPRPAKIGQLTSLTNCKGPTYMLTHF